MEQNRIPLALSLFELVSRPLQRFVAFGLIALTYILLCASGPAVAGRSSDVGAVKSVETEEPDKADPTVTTALTRSDSDSAEEGGGSVVKSGESNKDGYRDFPADAATTTHTQSIGSTISLDNVIYAVQRFAPVAYHTGQFLAAGDLHASLVNLTSALVLAGPATLGVFPESFYQNPPDVSESFASFVSSLKKTASLTAETCGDRLEMMSELAESFLAGQSQAELIATSVLMIFFAYTFLTKTLQQWFVFGGCFLLGAVGCMSGLRALEKAALDGGLHTFLGAISGSSDTSVVENVANRLVADGTTKLIASGIAGCLFAILCYQLLRVAMFTVGASIGWYMAAHVYATLRQAPWFQDLAGDGWQGQLAVYVILTVGCGRFFSRGGGLSD
ncbi:unnamed protein product [Amoebophrya sp. A25]|nr:unnamed protein product [Amoebophrya sp. A25]|eukprot:GSA25T00002183001.1